MMILVDIVDIEKKTLEYVRACYFIWLERNDVPLDIAPRTSGEKLIIGSHIRKIKNLRTWFRRNGLGIPNYRWGCYPDVRYAKELSRQLM
ncbi:hypothetical protein AIQ34_27330 [Salmonella enterica]|nr:hypothetical protein [Salmonella enterica]